MRAVKFSKKRNLKFPRLGTGESRCLEQNSEELVFHLHKTNHLEISQKSFFFTIEKLHES